MKINLMKSHKRLAEIHIIQARLRALRLFAFTSAVIPGEWSNEWNEIIIPDLLEFGFHARKVNEFCDLMEEEFSSIDTKLVTISEGDPGNWESSYRRALNALMHMNSFTMGEVHADHRKIYVNASNRVTTYIKVATDKYPEITISIYGLINCFLSEIIPRIRDRELGLTF